MPSSFLPTPPNARQDAVATHRRYLATALLLAAGSQLVACGGPDAEVVLGSPTPAPEVLSLTIELNGPAQSLERHDFELLVATEGGIKQLNDSALIDLDILSIDGSASTTGAIRAATTLSDGSVFYVAENGLFYGEGERILPSPLNASITASDVHAAYAAAGSQGTDRLWLGASGHLLRIEGQSIEKWSLPSNEAVSAICEANGTIVVAQGELLHELASDASSTSEIQLDSGAIHQIIAHNDGQTYFATDKGLVVRSAQGEYTRYTLSDDEAGVPVSAISSDPLAGVYLRTTSSLIRVNGAEFTGVAQSPDSTSSQLAVDFFGDAWIATDQGMAGYFVAPPLRFVEDGVQSALQVCNNCHSQDNHDSANAPYIPFDDHATASSYAGRIEARLSDAANPMPPSPFTVSNNDYQRILRWIATGSNP